jgi:hypothetical protein
MRALIVMAALLGACGADDPCEGAAPGMRFVIHLPVEAEPPGELSVTYASGDFDRFDVTQASPWPEPLVLSFAYGPNAVDGPAVAYFTSRPDPYRDARADFDVDLQRCVTAEMTLMELRDAGVDDAAP